MLHSGTRDLGFGGADWVRELDMAMTGTPSDHDLMETEVVGREDLPVVVPTSHALPARGLGDRVNAALREVLLK